MALNFQLKNLICCFCNLKREKTKYAAEVVSLSPDIDPVVEREVVSRKTLQLKGADPQLRAVQCVGWVPSA